MAFQGSLKELPLPDIIQLVSVSGKTGVFTLKDGEAVGEIYLRHGQIVHANMGDLSGEEAVYELAIWPKGDFVFHPGEESPISSIKRSNTNLLMEAARRIDEWQILSKKIPSTRLVPVFTQQANKTSISLAPQEWQLVSKIDERRTVEEVAIALGKSPFEACKVLYGMITSGLVALKEDLRYLDPDRLQAMTEPALRELASAIHAESQLLLSAHDRKAELETPYRLCRSELESGRRVDAITSLVRAQEKVVSAALGPNQSKTFLDRVERLLSNR